MLGGFFCPLDREVHVSPHDRHMDHGCRLLSIKGKNFSTSPNWLNHLIKEEAEEDKYFSLSGASTKGRILFLAYFFSAQL